MRWTFLAAVLGLFSGVVTACTLWLMIQIEHFLWQHNNAPLEIFLIIMVGGFLISLLRYFFPLSNLQALLKSAQDPISIQHKIMLAIALSAIVAVAFGGAIGPEAGLIAIVAELSAFVIMRLSHEKSQQQALGEAVIAGSMSALYASAPAGAVVGQTSTHSQLPKAGLWLSALMGLLGFMWVSKHILHGNFERLELPSYVAALDGTDLVKSVIPGAIGVAMGVLFVWLLPRLQKLLGHLGHPSVQTLVGTLIYAVIASYYPILRFSGHHELNELPNWLQTYGASGLMALALLKVLVLSICLASGWLGGAIFPLLLAGASAGLAVTAIMPEIPAAVALAAGMAGAATVGMGKPIVAVLILLFLAGPQTLTAMCVGAAIGLFANKKWSLEAIH